MGRHRISYGVENVVGASLGAIDLVAGLLAGHAPFARFASEARSHRGSGGCGSGPWPRKPRCGCPAFGLPARAVIDEGGLRLARTGPLRLASLPPGCRVGATGTSLRGSARQDVASNRPGRNPAVTREARRAKAPGCPCLWGLSIGQAIESASGVGNATQTKTQNKTNARNRSTSP